MSSPRNIQVCEWKPTFCNNELRNMYRPKVPFYFWDGYNYFLKVFESGVRLLRFALPHNNCVVWGKWLSFLKFNFLHEKIIVISRRINTLISLKTGLVWGKEGTAWLEQYQQEREWKVGGGEKGERWLRFLLSVRWEHVGVFLAMWWRDLICFKWIAVCVLWIENGVQR